MTKDAIYSETKLVEIYDSINIWGEDSEFYMKVAGFSPKRILDAGCGTGMLTMELAGMGHIVTGLDPSQEMIRFARSKERAETVEWIVSSIEDYRSNEKFDLIIMTGHAFQCLISDSNTLGAFRSVYNHLNENGIFVFETRNPILRPWEKWTPENPHQYLTKDKTKFEMYHRLISVNADTVTFETIYKFSDKSEYLSCSTIRFPSLDLIRDTLIYAGLKIDFLYGDWDRSQYTPGSNEIIITASINN